GSSLDRNEEQDSGLRRSSVERNKEGDGFGRLWWGETKEGDAVGGARLTIEIGAEFPIGIKDRHLARAKRQNANGWASNSKRTAASGEFAAFPQRPARTPKSPRPW